MVRPEHCGLITGDEVKERGWGGQVIAVHYLGCDRIIDVAVSAERIVRVRQRTGTSPAISLGSNVIVLAAASSLTLAWELGAFIGPLLLGSPNEITLAVEVQRQTIENNRWPRGAAAAAVRLFVVVLLLAASCLIVRSLTRRSAR